MTSEEKYAKFSLWKNDLEERLALFLFNNPEKEPEKKASPMYLRSPKVFPDKPSHRLRVEVREGIAMPGVWFVWVDGVILEQFNGPLAHQRATQCANKVINGAA